MKKSFLISAISICFLCIGIESCNNSTKIKSEEKVTYQCPMDCEKGKTYDKPGECPECNMDLEKGGNSTSTDSTEHVN